MIFPRENSLEQDFKHPICLMYPEKRAATNCEGSVQKNQFFIKESQEVNLCGADNRGNMTRVQFFFEQCEDCLHVHCVSYNRSSV